MRADSIPGFSYSSSFLSAEEEQALLRCFERIDFAEVRMHGVAARRRTAHFGLDYGYSSGRTAPGPPIPSFLLDLRASIAELAGVPAALFAEVLVSRYPPGAGIGWHRDAPMFGDPVVGVSLATPCVLRLRPLPRRAEAASASSDDAERPSPHAPTQLSLFGAAEAVPTRSTAPTSRLVKIELWPRSVYVLAGPARYEWQHSIPPVPKLRYSVTFRTARVAAADGHDEENEAGRGSGARRRRARPS